MDFFYVLEVFAKLTGVLLLFLGTALLARRWLGLSPDRRMRRLQVVESIRLAPRQSLHLVRAGDRYFLVGATDGSVALVSTLEMDEAQSEITEPAAPQGGLPFLAESGVVKFQQIFETCLKGGRKA